MNNSPHNPTLREQLDAMRPDTDDLRDPDVQEAARAIVESEEWRSVFNRQQAFDREVSNAMQDVDVPNNLQARLQNALSTDSDASNPPPSPLEGEGQLRKRSAEKQGEGAGRVSKSEPTPTSLPLTLISRLRSKSVPLPQGERGTAVTPPLVRPSRRTWTRTIIAASAMFLVAGLGWLFLPHGVTTFALDEVRQSLPFENGGLDSTSLTNFDGSFDAPLPSGPWSEWLQSEAAGLDLDGNGTHDAAIYEFAYRGTHGYLLVLPVSRISDPPARTFFNTATISYTPATNVAWIAPTEKVVYLCLLDHGQLDTLSRVLTPAAA
ncbi:MAG: hypothetical protein KDA86_22105 [Planctomycetaceae bacterium]|nr:hypothetical protein [Planctomycetaceae bacterium]